jgi:hypothetical protein
MVYDSMAGPECGAGLVFAHSVKEARHVGWKTLSDWHDSAWINIRARRLKETGTLLSQADGSLYNAGTPHIIESPIACKGCESWFDDYDSNGYCEACHESNEFTQSLTRNKEGVTP